MIDVDSVIQEVEESDQLVRLLACSNTKKERVIQVTCSTIGFTYTPFCRSPQRHIIAPSPAMSICLTINLLYCRIPPSITPHHIIILQWSLYSCVHYQLSAPTSVIAHITIACIWTEAYVCTICAILRFYPHKSNQIKDLMMWSRPRCHWLQWDIATDDG